MKIHVNSNAVGTPAASLDFACKAQYSYSVAFNQAIGCSSPLLHGRHGRFCGFLFVICPYGRNARDTSGYAVPCSGLLTRACLPTLRLAAIRAGFKTIHGAIS